MRSFAQTKDHSSYGEAQIFCLQGPDLGDEGEDRREARGGPD